MKYKASDLTTKSIGRAFTTYTAPNGTEFTFNADLKRIMLDDGSFTVYSSAENRIEAKQKAVNFLNTGHLDN